MIVRFFGRVLILFVLLARLAELPGPGIEAAEGARDLLVVLSQNAELASQRCSIGALHGPVAAVTAAIEAGTERAAAGLRNRSQTGNALRHRDADIALRLHSMHTL